VHWELAYRPRGVYEPTTTKTVDAASSAAAIEQLRKEVPADSLVLFVKGAQTAS
jgi:hypothetical protein